MKLSKTGTMEGLCKTPLDMPDPSGKTMLFHAIENNLNKKLIEELISHADKSYLEQADNSGNTALLLAIYQNDTNIFAKLISKKIEIPLTNALFLALNKGPNGLEIIKMLVAEGADINASDLTGQTPLMHACCPGNNVIFEYLLEMKVDLNAQTHDKDTALMLAVAMKNIQYVQLLLKAGADVSLKNDDDKTALDLAREDEDTPAELIALLEGVSLKKATVSSFSLFEPPPAAEIKPTITYDFASFWQNISKQINMLSVAIELGYEKILNISKREEIIKLQEFLVQPIENEKILDRINDLRNKFYELNDDDVNKIFSGVIAQLDTCLQDNKNLKQFRL